MVFPNYRSMISKNHRINLNHMLLVLYHQEDFNLLLKLRAICNALKSFR